MGDFRQPQVVAAAAQTASGWFGLPRARWLSIGWVLAMVAYSVVRALALAPLLTPYGISIWWFLTIDIGSAAPLAIAQVQTVQALRNRDAAGVQRWVALVAVSFLSPYLYLVLGAGRPFPSVAYYVLVLLVIVLGGATAYRIRQEARRGAPGDDNA